MDSRNADVVNSGQDTLNHIFDGYFTIKEAAEWATGYLHRTVSNANISYLINYGKVKNSFVTML